jgi:hypothetical protein
VRRITSRRASDRIGIVGQRQEAAVSVGSGKVMTNWRYITGTFQIKIPVGHDEALLRPEENTLAILKWRLQNASPTYRWYPILQRYISYVAGRVNGFGGNAGAVPPSLNGFPGTHKKGQEYTGKVSALIYDRFGDFEGFVLDTEKGEHKFFSREHKVEAIVNRALVERIRTSVFAEPDATHRPLRIVLHHP